MWDLLEALEGLCYQGRAMEIDDSTYKIIGGVPDDEDDIYGATDLSDEDRDKLDEISNRYVTSNPVSGDWETEVKHEQAAIAKELGVSMQQAKQIMIDELGFEEDQF